LNYYQAQELLERVKHGHEAPVWLINRALCLMGDLCGSLCSDGNDVGCDRSRKASGQDDGNGSYATVDWVGQGGGRSHQGVEKCYT